MSNPTQQQWAFRVSDGEVSETFTQLEGMYEIPDFTPNELSARDATTIDVASTNTTKKMKFNRQKEGGELSITCDYLRGEPAQDMLFAAVGNDEGINAQIVHRGSEYTLTWEFNVMVKSPSYKFATSNDAEAVDQVTFNLLVNSDTTENIASTI